jgi:hypothetical protein
MEVGQGPNWGFSAKKEEEEAAWKVLNNYQAA